MDHDAQNASASLSRNLRALWRFNWILVIGICLAVLAPTLMLYKAKWPPTPRARPSYVAETQILVDSPTGPFLRTQPRIVGTQSQSRSRPTNSGTAPVVPSVSDTKSLVDAANLLPLLVTSDEVSAVRQRLVGRIRGSVTAKALFASQGINRYRPSTVPVMEITAVARRPNPAIRLAEGTSRALRVWLNEEQQRANIPPNQRIVLRPLQAATSATRIGSAGKGLPMLVALAILAAFAGGAILLDRAWPRKERRPAAEEATASSEPRDSDDEAFVPVRSSASSGT